MSEIITQIETLINQGRFFEAHNLADTQLKSDPDNFRLKQLLALSMSKSGASNDAKEFLEPIYNQNKKDPETAGILGGIYKELFKKTQDAKYAYLSRDIYHHNFEITGDYYTGINAATMSMIARESKKGREIAAEVIKSLDKKENDFWELATLGEAWLLCRDSSNAIEFYTRARKMAGQNWGKINSIYAQLWLLNHYITVPVEVLEVFNPPVFAAFAGHMIDKPGIMDSRFPADIEDKVKTAIAAEIARLNIQIGFCSLACGSDILFAEAMQEAGAKINVCLPFDKDDFIETSIGFAGDQWVKRFETLLEQSDVKFTTKEKYFGDDVLFSLQGKVIFGSSVLQANLLHSKPFLITVLSEKDKTSRVGGTRDMVNQWPYMDKVININPDNFRSGSVEVINPETSDIESKKKEKAINRQILYILFADIVGFSQIDEDKAPYFIHHVWGTLAERMKDLFIKPLVLNTFGSTLFSVFSSASRIMEFASFLREVIDGFDYQEAGLIENIKIKIGLHAGPVYLGTDPLSKQMNSYGTHIARASSIQAHTLQGTIYASEQFSAVLTLESEKYDFEHVGVIDLGNDLGLQEIYKISNRK